MKKLNTILATIMFTTSLLSGQKLSLQFNNYTIPDDFIYLDEYGGSTYYVSNFTKSWTEAKSICEELNGYLVTISNEEENNIAYSGAEKFSLKRAWIGFTDENIEGNWEWVTGEEVTYTNWYDTNPNNNGGYENYAMIYGDEADRGGKWNDNINEGANGNRYFILEIEGNKYSLTDDFIYIDEYDGNKYYVSNFTETWTESKLICEALYGHLITISDDEENNIAFTGADMFTLKRAWIGFTDQNTEGNWEWVTGEQVSYTNWYDVNPNNNGGFENYALIYGAEADRNGTWNDNINEGANGNRYFVLEIEGSKYSLKNDFIYLDEFNGNKYYVSNFTQSWTEAKTICEELDGHLITISNEEENNIAFTGADMFSLKRAWIGFTDEDNEGVWEWVTGETVNFTKWYDVNPNNNGGYENYAMIYGDEADRGGQWNDNVNEGANGNRYFILEIESSSVSNVENNKSTIYSTYQLLQNYPNPFNPSTTINYSISKDGYVSLTVFDAIGNEILILEDTYKPAGLYSYIMDGRSLGSGIYFYRLKVNEYIQTKKMLLIK